MVYAISAVVAAMATFVWALCKVAASADKAARVAWYRRPQPPDEELDELVASVVEEVRGKTRSDAPLQKETHRNERPL